MRRRYRQQATEQTDTATSQNNQNQQDNTNTVTETHSSYRRRYGGNGNTTEKTETTVTTTTTTENKSSYRPRRFRSTPKDENNGEEGETKKEEKIVTTSTTIVTGNLNEPKQENRNDNDARSGRKYGNRRNYYQVTETKEEIKINDEEPKTSYKVTRSYYGNNAGEGKNENINESKREVNKNRTYGRSINAGNKYSSSTTTQKEEDKNIQNRSYKKDSRTEPRSEQSTRNNKKFDNDKEQGNKEEYVLTPLMKDPNPKPEIPEMDYRGKNFQNDFVKEVNLMREGDQEFLKALSDYANFKKIQYTYKPHLQKLVDPLKEIISNSSLSNIDIDEDLMNLAQKYHKIAVKNPIRRMYPQPQEILEEDLKQLKRKSRFCKNFVTTKENPRYALLDCIFNHFYIDNNSFFLESNIRNIGIHQDQINGEQVCIVIIEG